jgi:hypothetical protein
MVWALVIDCSTSGLVMSVLVIIGLLGLYALIFYFVLKPNIAVLTSLPIWSAIAVMATGGLIGGIIHTARFISSPQADKPWSLIMVVLYLFAGFNAYGILVWFTCSLWRKKLRQG